MGHSCWWVALSDLQIAKQLETFQPKNHANHLVVCFIYLLKTSLSYLHLSSLRPVRCRDSSRLRGTSYNFPWSWRALRGSNRWKVASLVTLKLEDVWIPDGRIPVIIKSLNHEGWELVQNIVFINKKTLDWNSCEIRNIMKCSESSGSPECPTCPFRCFFFVFWFTEARAERSNDANAHARSHRPQRTRPNWWHQAKGLPIIKV